MDDIARFYRALLGGRLLPPAQLAEMKTTVEIVPGVAGYGLGLFVFDTRLRADVGAWRQHPGLRATSSSAARTAGVSTG